MLDKVTVTAICWKLCFLHCWWIMREIKTSGNSFLCLIIICIMTLHEETAPVFTPSHLQLF